MIHSQHFSEIGSAWLYAILRLRVDVFVVEQRCAYPELDDRDLEADTRHIWIGEPHTAEAYARVLRADDGWQIGRVCTAVEARGRGLAGEVMRAALRHVGDDPVWMHAQVEVAEMYRRFGFTESGPRFEEDGIPHVPMTRG